MKLMTTKELSEELKVHRNTIYRWKDKGLPSYGKGAACRYNLEEVLMWLKNKR